jgi:quaternary ammonium compound-resistance protein SugE
VFAKITETVEAAMAWFYLFVAGLFEVAWAIGLKYTEGFSRLVPSLFTVAAMILSLALLGLALKTLPVGTAYAVWTGIGAVGTAALGIYLFGEPVTAARLASIGIDCRRHRWSEAGHLNACMTVMCIRMAPRAARAVEHRPFDPSPRQPGDPWLPRPP